jgi:hypothetical protein
MAVSALPGDGLRAAGQNNFCPRQSRALLSARNGYAHLGSSPRNQSELAVAAPNAATFLLAGKA